MALAAIVAGTFEVADQLGFVDQAISSLGIKTSRDPNSNLQIANVVDLPADVLAHYQSQINLARAEGDHSEAALDAFGDRAAVISANAATHSVLIQLGAPPAAGAPMPSIDDRTVGFTAWGDGFFVEKLLPASVRDEYVATFGRHLPVSVAWSGLFAGGGNRIATLYTVHPNVQAWLDSRAQQRAAVSQVTAASAGLETEPPLDSGATPPVRAGFSQGQLLVAAVVGALLFFRR